MTHQVPFTVHARIIPDQEASLRLLLERIGANPAGNPVFPFERLIGVHFARFVVLSAAKDLEGRMIPAALVFASNVDAPLRGHVDQLADEMGDGLDQVFRHCEGYPEPVDSTPARRRAFLKAHSIPNQAYYVNTVGRPVQQIRDEARLRDAMEDHLDDLLANDREIGLATNGLHEALRGFVRHDDSLRWALTPARKPPLSWRIKEKLHFLTVIIVLVLLLPVVIVTVPIWLLIIRFKEKQPTWDVDYRLSEQYREDLASLEDHVVHNQFSAVGFMKPGWVRLTTIRVLLWLVGFSSRHVFNKGDLGSVELLRLDGVDTIHFARWIILDEGRRVLFMSNYDGSLESYMDDFIDKVAWGLNLVFTNGVGYPKTRWLALDGANDEQQFKAFLRHHQIPTQVWYAAYDRQSAVNNTNNAQIRAGLSSRMDRQETEAWLRRL